MSRHITRKERWTIHSPSERRSGEGLVVRFFKRAWWAEIPYRVQIDGKGSVSWESHFERLGPFKRPRNAMVEAERYATILQNRHGDKVVFSRTDESTEPVEGSNL